MYGRARRMVAEWYGGIAGTVHRGHGTIGSAGRSRNGSVGLREGNGMVAVWRGNWFNREQRFKRERPVKTGTYSTPFLLWFERLVLDTCRCREQPAEIGSTLPPMFWQYGGLGRGRCWCRERSADAGNALPLVVRRLISGREASSAQKELLELTRSGDRLVKSAVSLRNRPFIFPMGLF